MKHCICSPADVGKLPLDHSILLDSVWRCIFHLGTKFFSDGLDISFIFAGIACVVADYEDILCSNTGVVCGCE